MASNQSTRILLCSTNANIESNWYIMWMQSFPGYGNKIPYGNRFLSNWWRFVSNWDKNNTIDLHQTKIEVDAICSLSPPVPGSNLTYNIDDSICGTLNNTIKIPIRTKNFKNIRSFQFTVAIADSTKGSIVSIEKGVLDGDMNFSYPNASNAGLIWDNTQADTLPDDHIVAYANVKILSSFNTFSDILLNGQVVDVYAEDGAGKSITPTLIKGSYCVNTSFTISGKITREDGLGLPNVTFNLTGPVNKNTITDNNGNYSFADISTSGNFTIKPIKDISYKNGVNSGDVSAIRRHILKTELLGSPYKIIAADAKNPVSINTGDVSELRQLILGNITDLPERESWTFVDKFYTFPDPLNPFSSNYPTTIIINITSNKTGLDFIGIKVGDVNNDNNPSNSNSPEIETRSKADLYLLASNAITSGNQKFSINITAKQFSNIRAGQLSLNWDKEVASFESISNINSALGGTDVLFNTTQPGKLGFIWDTDSQVSLAQDAVLFTLNLKSLNKKTISPIKFSNDPVDIYFEDKDGKQLNVITQDGNVTVPVREVNAFNSIVLYPNPTSGVLYLKSPSKMNFIKVTNLTGRQLLSFNASGNKVDLSNLGSGSYFVQIFTDKTSTIQKVIIQQ